VLQRLHSFEWPWLQYYIENGDAHTVKAKSVMLYYQIK
jgi:hypothetical protein